MYRSAYRWFPHGLFVAMGLVFAVNGYFVYVAVASFPGAAGTDGFDLSNGYDKVLATYAKQAALGWQVEVAVDDAGHPMLRLADRLGTPLPGVSIDAHAERPLGPPEATKLAFRAVDQDRFQTDAPLGFGQWDLLMTVTSGDSRFTATRRVVVK
jgi:nitrogen fixation protein FixH